MIHTCECCAFSTTVISNYKRHILSKKHMKMKQKQNQSESEHDNYNDNDNKRQSKPNNNTNTKTKSKSKPKPQNKTDKPEEYSHQNILQFIMEKLNTKENELIKYKYHDPCQINEIFDIIRIRIQK